MHPRNRIFFLGLFSAVMLASCKKPAPAGPTVKLYVDEKEVATIAVTTSPVALAGLLPKAASDPTTWRRIEGRASGGRFLDVRQPVATYQNGEARLYLQQGAPAIGIFRPVREGLPEHVAKIARQPAVSLTDVVDVRVYTKDPPPVTLAELLVEPSGLAPYTMVPEDLEEFPEVKQGNSAASRGQGRNLADIVRFRTSGTIDRVVVEGRDGRSHTVTAAELDDRTKPLLVKVNNKNQWVFKVMVGSEATVEVRDLLKLRIEGTDLRGHGGMGDGSGGGRTRAPEQKSP